MRTSCGVIVVVVAIVAARVSVVRADGGPRTTFAWATPCRVPVIEVDLKDGNTVKLSYDVVVERSGDDLHLQMENYAFLEVNGRDATVPPLRDTLREATLMTGAVPAIRISQAGEYLGIVDPEKAVTKLLENPYFRRSGGDSEKMRKLMLSPQMLAVFTNQMGGIWGAWVGRWLDHVPASGKRLAFTEQIELGKATFTSPITISNLGPADGAPGAVRLRAESALRSKELAHELSEVLSSLFTDVGTKDSLRDMLTDGERRVVMEVDTDVSTLRPRRALLDITLQVKLKDGKERSEKQRRETTFHWDRAKGACAPYP